MKLCVYKLTFKPAGVGADGNSIFSVTMKAGEVLESTNMAGALEEAKRLGHIAPVIGEVPKEKQ